MAFSTKIFHISAVLLCCVLLTKGKLFIYTNLYILQVNNLFTLCIFCCCLYVRIVNHVLSSACIAQCQFMNLVHFWNLNSNDKTKHLHNLKQFAQMLIKHFYNWVVCTHLHKKHPFTQRAKSTSKHFFGASACHK